MQNVFRTTVQEPANTEIITPCTDTLVTQKNSLYKEKVAAQSQVFHRNIGL